MTERRYQMQYGINPGDKGYVVVDTAEGPQFAANRKVVFTTDNKSEAIERAEQLNGEQP